MSIVELTSGIIKKIVGIYPNINIEELSKKTSEMQIIESEIGEKVPFVFDQNNNILKLNSSKLLEESYDLEYYMTVVLLNMTKPFDSKLQGIRTGYFAGVASNLVGNYTEETMSEIKPGIDLYESLRAGIADLSSRIGALKTSELCESESLEEFLALATDLGLENPEQFLNSYNYLALNSANLTEKQRDSLVSDMSKTNQSLELKSSKTI